MSSEVAFNASAGAFSMYGALLREIAEELGMEKALTLHARRGVAFGAMTAGMIKDELGDDDFNMQAVASVLSGSAEGFGVIAEVEATPTTVKMEISRCPIYEGCKMAGWSHEEIEMLCNRLATAEAAELKKVFPQVAGKVTFRATAETPCVEEYRLQH